MVYFVEMVCSELKLLTESAINLCAGSSDSGQMREGRNKGLFIFCQLPEKGKREIDFKVSSYTSISMFHDSLKHNNSSVCSKDFRLPVVVFCCKMSSVYLFSSTALTDVL